MKSELSASESCLAPTTGHVLKVECKFSAEILIAAVEGEEEQEKVKRGKKNGKKK